MADRLGTDAKPALVEVLDADGNTLFRNLIDRGENVMRFESGFGFVEKDQCRRNGWTIQKMGESPR